MTRSNVLRLCQSIAGLVTLAYGTLLVPATGYTLAPLHRFSSSSSDRPSQESCFCALVLTESEPVYRYVSVVRAGGPPARTKRGVKVACLLLCPALYFQQA